MFKKNLSRRSTLLLPGLFLSVFSACTQTGTETVGTVNGQPVEKAVFDAYLTFKRIPKDDKKAVSRALTDYLERESMAQAIKAQKLLDPLLLQAEVDAFRRQALIGQYFDQYLATAITDEAVRNYYVANQAKYQSTQIHVAHILFRTRPEMSEPELEALMGMARDTHARLLNGEDFAALAKELSQDKVSAKKGGDLGWVKEGAIAAQFSSRVFNLEAGTFTAPFATVYGYHIATVLADARVIKRPLEAVQGDIRYRLKQNAKRAEVKRLLEQMPYTINQEI